MNQQWKTYPDTGYLEIDVEHRAISQELEKLQGAIKANRPAEIGVLLTSVVTQVAEHFAHEERLMQTSGYPKLQKHSEAHAVFVRDAVSLQRDFAQRGLTPELRRWATGRLHKWFRFHILAHDVELGLFLAGGGRTHREVRA